MILKKLPLFLAGSALFFCSSCIQDEALNAECDIIGVDSLWLKANKNIIIGTPIITNNSVSFNIQKGTDRTQLSPSFYLTSGASLTINAGGTLVDANGATLDFSSPQKYTTHSEDGNWSKEYTVSFNYPQPIRSCGFEHYELDASKRYHVWYEIDREDQGNPRRDYWASGNAGYALTGMGKDPYSYPTTSEPQGVIGNGVKLETRSTGSFGQAVNMPIAAGNLFIGEFNASQAMLWPRKATRFGLQLVGGKPIALTGFYKYKAGEVFTDKLGKVDMSRKDTCDIYAVIYEVNPEKFVALNGDDVLSSERIVCMARIDNPGEPSQWTRFKEPFRPMNGKKMEEERLRNDGYAIAIVATSSRQGAYFEGAIGSVLYIDEIKVIWEGQDEEDSTFL